MAIIKGNAVANATSYELYEVTSGEGSRSITFEGDAVSVFISHTTFTPDVDIRDGRATFDGDLNITVVNWPEDVNFYITEDGGESFSGPLVNGGDLVHTFSGTGDITVTANYR